MMLLPRRLLSNATLSTPNFSEPIQPLKSPKSGALHAGFDAKLAWLLPDLDANTFSDYLLIPRAGWQSFFSAEPVKYTLKCPMLFKRYQQGSLAAHHYPLGILPRQHSARIPGDLFVTPYTLDEINYTTQGGKRIRCSLSPGIKQNGQLPLLHNIYKNVNVLVIFSGNPPTADSYTAMQWKDAISSKAKTSLLLYSPSLLPLKWLSSRYVKAVATSVVESAPFYSLCTRLNSQNLIDLHQYRDQMPSVLLVDQEGYIRWHAVGKPTSEALTLLEYSLGELKGL